MSDIVKLYTGSDQIVHERYIDINTKKKKKPKKQNKVPSVAQWIKSPELPQL